MPWEDDYADSLMYLIAKTLDAESRGHFWKRDSITYPDGYTPPDVFAMSIGNHNGPVCEACRYEFCHHCRAKPDIECPRPLSEAGREAALTLARER